MWAVPVLSQRPSSDRLIRTAGSESATIGRKGDGRHLIGMPSQRETFASGLSVQVLHSVSVAADGQQLHRALVAVTSASVAARHIFTTP